MNSKALTKRAEMAMFILTDGGYFRRALETDSYTRREQFKTRLYTCGRQVVKNIGYQTYAELEAAGLLRRRDCAPSSLWPTEYVAAGK